MKFGTACGEVRYTQVIVILYCILGILHFVRYLQMDECSILQIRRILYLVNSVAKEVK